MSLSGDSRHPPAPQQQPPSSTAGDPLTAALTNLSAVRTRMDSLQSFLAHSVHSNVLLPQHQMDRVNSELTAAIRDVIVHGAALISASQPPGYDVIEPQENLRHKPEIAITDFEKIAAENLKIGREKLGFGENLMIGGEKLAIISGENLKIGGENRKIGCRNLEISDFEKIYGENLAIIDGGNIKISGEKLLIGGENLKMGGEKLEISDFEQIDGGETEIVEIDAVELLAEHIHFCEICGKGFKRDANLRMHMRAHGNQFKSPAALTKPPENSAGESSIPGIKKRFSCPYIGCNRNKSHRNFRPLKSAICVKNHFKRSHCPKMYGCNRCRKKSFSVLADLKSHQKHCGGEARWRCTCGTTFSRKDKLFGHVALFEGHMPAIDSGGGGASSVTVEEERREDSMMIGFGGWENQGRMEESVGVDEDDWSMSMMEEFLNF